MSEASEGFATQRLPPSSHPMINPLVDQTTPPCTPPEPVAVEVCRVHAGDTWGVWSVVVGTRSFEVIVDQSRNGDTDETDPDGVATANRETLNVEIAGVTHRVILGYDAAPLHLGIEAGGSDAPADTSIATVRAPMPGRIVRLDVGLGDTVVRGQTVAIIEAMKMESTITASRVGQVTDIFVVAGATVTTRQPLLQIGR